MATPPASPAESVRPRRGVGLGLVLAGLLLAQLATVGAFVWARPRLLDPAPSPPGAPPSMSSARR